MTSRSTYVNARHVQWVLLMQPPYRRSKHNHARTSVKPDEDIGPPGDPTGTPDIRSPDDRENTALATLYITNLVLPTPISTSLACSRPNKAAGIFALNTAPTVYNWSPQPRPYRWDVRRTPNYTPRLRIYLRRPQWVIIDPRKKITTAFYFFVASQLGPPVPVPVVFRHLRDYHRHRCRHRPSVPRSGQAQSIFADPTQFEWSECYRWP